MSVLFHIPQVFTPELLRLMMEMGHGEELLICDANFPYRSTGCQQSNIIHIPGCTVAALLEKVLEFFPLDQSVNSAAVVMESAKESDTFDKFSMLLRAAPYPTVLETVPRFPFYDRAKKAVGVVVTSDMVKGGNILIKKGVVRDESV